MIKVHELPAEHMAAGRGDGDSICLVAVRVEGRSEYNRHYRPMAGMTVEQKAEQHARYELWSTLYAEIEVAIGKTQHEIQKAIASSMAPAIGIDWPAIDKAFADLRKLIQFPVEH